MKKTLPVLLCLFVARAAFPSACCLGGGPKSFLSLQELEKYQVGVSSSFTDAYGRFSPYGELIKSSTDQNATVSLGAAVRLNTKLEVSTVIPMVHQVKASGGGLERATNIGDVLISGQYVLIKNLFQDDWYPTIALVGGLKFPTGSVENVSGSSLVPGTGNGIWEPYLGLNVQKNISKFTFGVGASYTARLPLTVNGIDGPQSLNEGDRIELSETVTYTFTRRFALSVGALQVWDFTRTLDGQEIADSNARLINFTISPIYFFSRYLSLQGTFEAAAPIEAWSMNQIAKRSFSLTLRYGFY